MYASFYLIRKIGTKSTIKLCDDVNPNAPTERINVNPVKNSYAALWDEYKEVQSAVPLMNVIRRILEYYFLQLCGYEGSQLRQVILIQGKAEGRFKDADGNDDEENQNDDGDTNANENFRVEGKLFFSGNRFASSRNLLQVCHIVHAYYYNTYRV